jgi:SAM-dependent methyltransferase
MTLPAAFFDRLYATSSDPWSFTSRWYEQRKRALTVAALRRPRYRSGFEPGCSIGLLTEALAPRCDRLLAVDIAEVAVEQARLRMAAHPHVRVERAALPAWPPKQFDLVVLSEVGYYLAPDALSTVLSAAVNSLEPGGDLVAVHWRHPVPEHVLSGDAVHHALSGLSTVDVVSRTEEADFFLEVYTRTPPAPRSVAQLEGLC